MYNRETQYDESDARMETSDAPKQKDSVSDKLNSIYHLKKMILTAVVDHIIFHDWIVDLFAAYFYEL